MIILTVTILFLTVAVCIYLRGRCMSCLGKLVKGEKGKYCEDCGNYEDGNCPVCHIGNLETFTYGKPKKFPYEAMQNKPKVSGAVKGKGKFVTKGVKKK